MHLINKIKQNVIINNGLLYNNFNFDKNDNTPKLYFSEVLIITNETNCIRMYEWLDWHLNVIKFDHIVLIDNNNNEQLKNTCLQFKNIEYIHKAGTLNQSAIYTEHVNNSKSQWVLPIDDDEYLYIADEFNNNINDYLRHLLNIKQMYKYSFNWHMMFANEIFENEVNSFINLFKYTIFDKINFECNDAFSLCKTIVNTDIKHLYINEINTPIKLNYNDINAENAEDKSEDKIILGSVHNPISKLNNTFVHSYNPEANQIITGIIISKDKTININAHCFIAHYKYTSKNRWYNKISNFNFTDIFNNDFLKNNYRKNTYYTIYDFVKNKLILQDNLYKLYNKNNRL